MSEEKNNNQVEDTDAAEQSPAEPPEADAPEEAAEPLAELTAERDELKDRLLRLAAETENFKKRSEREKAEFLKRSNERLVKDLLPVMDNLDRALEAAGEAVDQGLAEGLRLTGEELFKVLERYGLEPVEALGKAFDPEFHEAMMQQENPDVEENTVVQELQKGFLFQGRLLRPAMVVVSKRPPAEEDEDQGEDVKITIN